MRSKVKVTKLVIAIERICTKSTPDDNYDYSDLGDYVDVLEDGVIDRSTGEFWKEGQDRVPPRWRTGDWRGFKPYAGGEKVGTENYKKYGLQDYRRMEAYNKGDWQPLYICAKACVSYPLGDTDSRRLETLTSGGIGGVESDGEKNYIQSILDEELDDLKRHLVVFGVDLSRFDELAKKAKEKGL